MTDFLLKTMQVTDSNFSGSGTSLRCWLGGGLSTENSIPSKNIFQKQSEIMIFSDIQKLNKSLTKGTHNKKY